MIKRRAVNFVPTKNGNKQLSMKDDRLAFGQQDQGEVRSNGERSFSGAENVGLTNIGLTGKDIHEARNVTGPLTV